MAFTHDVVIIGATPEGIHAARKGIDLKKRVALVLQPSSERVDAFEAIFVATTYQILRFYQFLNQWEEEVVLPPWERLHSWAGEVDATVKARDSLAALAALGVDVVEGSGEFVRLPRLGFVVGGRKLSATAYLVATGCRPRTPAIRGLEEVSYLTPRDIWTRGNPDRLPHRLAIVGGTPIALQLAQLLRRQGKEILSIVPDRRPLPGEDGDVSRLVGAILEAEGIELVTNLSVAQIKAIDGKKWLQLGDRAVEVDEVVIAGTYGVDDGGLNLEGVGVTVEKGGIGVNDRLRTANPRIYTCSLPENGSPDPTLDRYLAGIAMKNALLKGDFPAEPLSVPRSLPLVPPIARVGLTEQRARQLYGPGIRVFHSPLKNSIARVMTGESTGFCKIVVRDNGKILGAHFVGPGTEEAIGSIALAMREDLGLDSLDASLYPFPSVSETIAALAARSPRRRSPLARQLARFRKLD